MAITGDQRLLKRINRMALVRLVRNQPGLSRAELAVETGLTKSTVSLLVQELIEEGWLREDEVLITGAIGRRPTPLRLDDRRLALIGAELGVGALWIVATSLSGELIDRKELAFAVGTPVGGVLDLLGKGVVEIVARVGATGREILGVGIGVPGAVQENSGVLRVAPNLGWHDVAVRDDISRILLAHDLGDIPVFVQNDADVGALSEVEFSTAEGDPLLFMSLGVGVGAGVVVGGRLLLGRRGFAGEIGHIQLQANGPQCSCGRRGCAEAFFGLQALAAAANTDSQTLFERAAQGDPAVVPVLQEAGKRLGVLMHNLWVILDPAQIVLGGPSCRLGSVFIDSARQAFDALVSEADLEAPDVVLSRYGELAVPAGAAALVLHRYLQPI